jgi:peptidoglycan/xylan/chitin deacetylase (PgdA/CDA1 family)
MSHSLVLCYHAFSHSWPSDLAITRDQLREELHVLLGRGYVPATFAAIAGGRAPVKAFAVTFDDGYRSVVTKAFPVMAELGVPGTIFVTTNWVGAEAPMSWPGIDHWTPGDYEDELIPAGWQELRGLIREGWEVGSHTMSHPRLSDLDEDALAAELAGSREKCTSELGVDCISIAYPYGDSDRRVEAATAKAGYLAAAGLGLDGSPPYRWPRIGIYPGDRGTRFRLKVSPVVRRARGSRLGRLVERYREERASSAT